jgi:hypothetical protein
MTKLFYEIKKNDWTREYAAIGRFVVEFEKISHAMRFKIQVILQEYGLNNWALGEIILHQKCFGADTISQTYSAIISELVPEDQEIKKLSREIFQEFDSLTEFRNKVVHCGEWYIGDDVTEISDKPEPSPLKGIRRNPSSKRGRKIEEIVQNVEELESKINDLKQIKEKLNKLDFLITKAIHEINPQSKH